MSTLSLSIVPVYAAVLGILFLALTIAVIRNRYRLKVSLGDGGDERMNRIIRGHGNFAEYVPMSLLLLAFADPRGLEQEVLPLEGALSKAIPMLAKPGQTGLERWTVHASEAWSEANLELEKDDAAQALFDAFIQTTAAAIDEKSPYTAGHVRRVAQLNGADR